MVSASKKLGIISIPVIGTPRVAFGLFGLAAGMIFQSVFLETVLNIGLILSVSLVVARISAMLLASAFFFSRVYSRSHSPILYWYSLALATTSFAFFAFFATLDNGDLATWTETGGLCLASIYSLKSVLAAPKTIHAGQGVGAKV
jgi:hypothetical protein